MSNADIIVEIEEFARFAGIAPATVTSRAVGNSRLHRNLKAGRTCTLAVAERVRAYMTAHRSQRPEASE
ncbi:hypothetical protein [Oceanicella sp. SM1341]|uniref:hypothetical protein n=1 Tax=Oceanicella sp. SM1341 TaxID=1548889 RepID=UPI000E48A10D|nr:hypothetical protein [Oceanicella sp. SM1341]